METDEAISVARATDKPMIVPVALPSDTPQIAALAAAPNVHEKTLIATRIYTKWRNDFLGSMPQQAFLTVENSSAALIAAIARAL